MQRTVGTLYYYYSPAILLKQSLSLNLGLPFSSPDWDPAIPTDPPMPPHPPAEITGWCRTLVFTLALTISQQELLTSEPSLQHLGCHFV